MPDQTTHLGNQQKADGKEELAHGETAYPETAKQQSSDEYEKLTVSEMLRKKTQWTVKKNNGNEAPCLLGTLIHHKSIA